ncbi:predicted helicase [Moesziomyces antarcticus T-34]|uniref:Predicted helicase n=1 Tax=Pseudozyma antarctica (strain T-34) TaxID=1151754 RepID=M9MCZ3_PSEA3|nr:predicted helicase [Moesziomyces antarcticus T-34]
MVGVKKFSAIAAVSMVAVSGAAASIQQHDASHAHHVLAHRALTDRQPQLIKVQKRLAATIGDGLGGIINGLGRDLGLNDLDEAEYRLHNLRRGLVGDVLGAGGGQPPSASSSSAPAPATTSRPASSSNNNGGGSSASAAATGVNRANSSGSSSSDGTTKVVVPIVVIAASVAVIAVAWTIIRRVRRRKQEQFDPRLRPIDHEYHHRNMASGLAAGGAAFAVGGAADGLVRDRPRRASYESFEATRPMSTLTEEAYGEGAPPMQEVAPYAAVGPASSRLRNYGSQRGGKDDFPPAHRVTDSMYVDDAAAGRGASPYSDDQGVYDVNYYDGSSSAGYNNRATRGLDAAAVNSGAGRPYSPYEEVQRGGEGDYYDYDRASSSRRDPFADSKRWSG